MKRQAFLQSCPATAKVVMADAVLKGGDMNLRAALLSVAARHSVRLPLYSCSHKHLMGSCRPDRC